LGELRLQTDDGTFRHLFAGTRALERSNGRLRVAAKQAEFLNARWRTKVDAALAFVAGEALAVEFMEEGK
jgi:hypothetical protein